MVFVNRRTFLQGSVGGLISLVIGCNEEGQVQMVGMGDRDMSMTETLDMNPEINMSDDMNVSEDMMSPDQMMDNPMMPALISPWIQITADNQVEIAMHKGEMGQGVHTTLPLIIAEELDVSLSQVKVTLVPELAPFNLGVGLPATYGSTSVMNSFDKLRRLGASARAMLVKAAASRWSITEGEVEVADGVCIANDQEPLTYGELLSEVMPLDPAEEIVLKSPEQFKIIGKDVERLIDRDIVEGKAGYGIDSIRDNGLYAAVKHAPTPTGVPQNVDQLRSDVVGVHSIVALPHAVAVVADSFWTAQNVLNQLAIEFSQPEDEGNFNSIQHKNILIQALDEEGEIAKDLGDVEMAFSTATQNIEMDYYVPYIAHAPMETVNATAYVTEDRCELWVPTQSAAFVSQAVARVTGFSGSQITINPTLMGGAFGRKVSTDYPEMAVRIAMTLDRPVTLIWSREEDIQYDHFRPCFAGRMKGAINEAGDLIAWEGINSGDSVLGFGARDPLSVQGLQELVYGIPNQRVRHVYKDAPIPTGYWRSVGHSQNTFFAESFIDEMAHLVNKDAIEFRLALLNDRPRVTQVLQRVREMSNWGTARVEGASQGVAICADYGSFLALVCEVSVDMDTQSISVHHVDVAVDCGIVIQPNGVKAQVEGGLLFGLSAALHEEITFEQGQAQQTNFFNYPILKPDEVPSVSIEIIQSNEAPGGTGEISVGAIAPAVANAIFKASTLRCRTLPLVSNLKNMING